MKKFLKLFLLVCVLLPCAFVFVGCDNDIVSIKSIDKTASSGRVDTYTITYTNDETYQFTVVNGEDGENIYSSITINDLYNEIKGSKPEDYTLLDFINEYLDIQVDTSGIASSKALRSAVSIFAEHQISIVDYNNILGYTQTPFGTQINYGVKNSISWSAGAGVIYSLDKQAGDAYIITNYHVCFSSDALADDGIGTKFTCYLYGGESIDLNDLAKLSYYNQNCKEYEDLFEYDINGLPIIDYGYGAITAEYIGGSKDYDIAVLKITNSDLIKNSDALAVTVEDSDTVTAGTKAIAVGNPDACGIAVTEGIVSVDSEFIQVEIDDSQVVLREFRIDTPVNSGNSGGGLFDGEGNLIGIVNAKTNDTNIENMSYAIPSNIATRVAQSIINNCDGVNRKTEKVVLGITIETTNSKGVYNEDTGLMSIVEEVSISYIEQNSIASQIELQIGDIINSVEIINDEGTVTFDIERSFTLIDAMLLVKEGDCVKFNYTRLNESGSCTTPVLTETNFISVE